MVVEQKIEIIVRYNDEEVGTLSISSKIKKESEDDFSTIKPQNVKGMLFEHIEKDHVLNNTTPIQYCPTTSHSTDIFLLEETEYNITFIVNEKFEGKNELNVFNHLKNHSERRRDIKFNHWNEVWFANVNFRSFAGKTFIDIIYKGTKLINLMVEVRTKKLNYDVEYAEMIADFARYSSGLMFNINSSLYQNLVKSDESQSTLYEYFMLLEYLFRPQNLPSVVEYLSRNLYSLLDTTDELVPTPFASNIGSDEIAELCSNPQEFSETNSEYSIYTDDMGKHYAPVMIKEMTHKDNIDIPENRFYKFFLEFIRDLINNSINKVEKGYVKDSLKVFRDKINLFLSHRYFNDISRLDYIPLNSQVLQKKEGYREILEYYLMFEFGLKISFEAVTDKFRGYEKELGKTYEIWGYFKLIDIVTKLTNDAPELKDFIDLDSWSLSLDNNKKLPFKKPLKIDKEEVQITLWYNKEFSKPEDGENKKYSAYSLPQDPDFTLELKYKDNIKFLHFDTKYRVDKDNKYKKDDIDKMHAYKDAITNTFGAYILYPGKKRKVFDEIDGDFGSVGAFILKPGQTEENEKEIMYFIKKIVGEWIDQVNSEVDKST